MKPNYTIIMILTCALFGQAALCHAAPPASCLFSTTPGSSLLQFGTLNPSSLADVSRSTSIQFSCTKGGQGGNISYQITETRSPNYSGGYRMQNSSVTTEYIRYDVIYTLNAVQITFPYTGSSSNGVVQTINISGTVLGTGYVDAYSGPYQDLIQYNITP